jgi:CRISPR-associated protein Cas2
MIILTLTDCPPSLRGDLSKWLVEISTGVYVGRVSARVRESLWERVKEYAKTGRATLVYPAKNEQRMVFRVHNSVWEPINFDGLTLMLHPSNRRLSERTHQKAGFSKAHQIQKAKQISKKSATTHPNEYVVFDIETTGLYPNRDEIIEIAGVYVKNGKIVSEFHRMICAERSIPPEVSKLTGITDSTLREHGYPIEEVMREFLQFIGCAPLISHNLAFDIRFLREAMDYAGLPELTNQGVDTLALARKKLRGLKSYSLENLMKRLDLPFENPHRSMEDVRATMRLYQKLIENQDQEN